MRRGDYRNYYKGHMDQIKGEGGGGGGRGAQVGRRREQEGRWGQVSGRGKTKRGPIGWLISWNLILGSHRRVFNQRRATNIETL